jgi:hypothetical protein
LPALLNTAKEEPHDRDLGIASLAMPSHDNEPFEISTYFTKKY